MASTNQPPIFIAPDMDKNLQWSYANQNFTLLNNQLQTFGYSNSVTVTRPASTTDNSSDVLTGIRNSPVYVCFASIPNSSPAFIRTVPEVSYSLSSGTVEYSLRALYDPTTGVIRCFVESPSSAVIYPSAQTWTFTFYLIRPTSRS